MNTSVGAANRMRARDLLTPQDIAEARRASWWKGPFAVIHAWTIMIGAAWGLAAAWSLSPWAAAAVWPLCVMIIGARQLGLTIAMHDAAHGALHPNKRINRLFGASLSAWFIFARLGDYRTYHLLHHARTQQPNDPDIVLSRPFPVTPASLRRKIWRDLSGRTGWNQRKNQLRNAWGKDNTPLAARLHRFKNKMGCILLAQGCVLAAATLAGYPWLFVFAWLIPLLTWQQLATRLRNIAEHAVVRDNDDPLLNTRSVQADWLERALLAPYNVQYHLAHHALMWVPFYNLHRLDRTLVARARAAGRKVESVGSYAAVLARAASRDPTTDTPHNQAKQEYFGFAQA